MKRKILFVPSWYPSEADPISGVFIQEQANALATQYDVAVLIPGLANWRNLMSADDTQRSTRDTSGAVAVYREFARPLIPHGRERIDYQTFSRAAKSGFKKILRDFGKPDIIHGHVVLPGGWSALQLGQQHSIPVVLTEHSSPFSMHLDTEVKRQLVKQTLNGISQVIAVSPALAKQLRKFEPNLTVKIIGNIVSTDFFLPSANSDYRNNEDRETTRFFIVARLAEQKGLSYLLRAVELLNKTETRPFELLLGGDGPDRAELERLASDLGVSDKCRFLGRLDRSGVKQWMNQSDVFVLSSLHETFGVVVGEAMSCGKPVISTRCGGPEYIVTNETGVLVDVASAESLADAMSAFILGRVSFDAEKIRQSVVERFGVDAFLRNISHIYESLWSQ